MGSINRYYCSNCDFKFEPWLGIGMLYDEVHQKNMKKARDGEFGTIIQTFLQEHPNGDINDTQSIYYCPKCGMLHSATSLDMYLIEEDSASPNSKYLRKYKLIQKYPHHCYKCNAVAEEIDPNSLNKRIKEGSIVCPCCGAKMNEEEIGMWD